MSVSDISATIVGSQVVFQWTNPVIGTRAISVQLSKNINFLEIVRTFAIPPGEGLTVDIGNGNWYYRIGI
jgi:hypothetical protein